MREQKTKKIKLSKAFIDEAMPGLYHDSDLSGFQLEVTPTSKTYRVRARQKGGGMVKVLIGKHGQPWTISQAREAAAKYLLEIKQGVNPNEKRREETLKKQQQKKQQQADKKRRSLNLQAAFDDYISSKGIKSSTAYVYRCDVEKCLKDWLAEPITEITSKMVQDRHAEISKTFPGQANHTMRILRAVINHASDIHYEEHGIPLILINPVRTLSKLKRWNKLQPRQDVIRDEDLKAWAKAVNNLSNSIISAYLFFTLVTGLRKNESASLKWTNVDFKSKFFTIEDTKNNRQHYLPLTKFTIATLEHLKSVRQNEYVFPGNNGHIKDVRHYLDLVEQASKVIFTLHTLRRTFTTIAATRLPEYTVKKLTNHIDKSDVTQGYAIIEVEKLRQPLNQVEHHILKCAGIHS